MIPKIGEINIHSTLVLIREYSYLLIDARNVRFSRFSTAEF